MPRARQLIGYVINADDKTQRLPVYQSGRRFWITDGTKEHVCHPSVRGTADVPSEAILVFHISNPEFEYVQPNDRLQAGKAASEHGPKPGPTASAVSRRSVPLAPQSGWQWPQPKHSDQYKS